MFFLNVLAALAGLSSLAAAAPTQSGPFKDRRMVVRANKDSKKGGNDNGKNNNNKNNNNINVNIEENTIIIEQTVIRPTVTIVEENLDLVSELALLAEQEFAALVESQLALIQEVEIIKNNIRVNHFLAKFTQVNTVIVVVTELVDLRDTKKRNSRYMVNQLLADNGHASSSVVVMVTAASPVTISAAPTPSLDLAGLLGANASSVPSGVVASVIASASASATAASLFSNSTSSSSNSTKNASKVAAFDPSNPFGQIGQTLTLPYGSKPPSLPDGAQIVDDPARIILPNQNTLLVEDFRQFSRDCALYTSNNGASLFDLQSSSIVVAIEQISAVEVSGLTLGSASSLNAAIGGDSSGKSGSSSGSSSAAPAPAATTAAAITAAPAASTAAAASSTTASVVEGGGSGVQFVPVPAA